MFDGGDAAEPIGEALQQREAIVAQCQVVDVHHYTIEEGVDLRTQSGEMGEGVDVVAVGECVAGFGIDGFDSFGEGAFGRFFQQCGIDGGGNVAVGFLEDVADALVGGGQRGGFRQRGEGADGVDAAVEVVERCGMFLGDRAEMLGGDTFVSVVAAQAVENEFVDFRSLRTLRQRKLKIAFRSILEMQPRFFCGFQCSILLIDALSRGSKIYSKLCFANQCVQIKVISRFNNRPR